MATSAVGSASSKLTTAGGASVAPPPPPPSTAPLSAPGGSVSATGVSAESKQQIMYMTNSLADAAGSDGQFHFCSSTREELTSAQVSSLLKEILLKSGKAVPAKSEADSEVADVVLADGGDKVPEITDENRAAFEKAIADTFAGAAASDVAIPVNADVLAAAA